MKAIKKKIFTKGTFLFLALMLMLTPFTFAVAADETIADECYHAEASVLVEVEGEPVMVTMSSAISCSAYFCMKCHATVYSCVSSCYDQGHKRQGHGSACK